jgi:hypothetical protein
MKSVFMASWQQLASALFQEMIPYILALKSHNIYMATPFYNPSRSSVLQPFEKPGPTRKLTEFLDFHKDIEFDNSVISSHIKSVDVIESYPHCIRNRDTKLLLPDGVNQTNFMCVTSFDDLVVAVKTSRADATLIFTLSHYKTGWKMPSVSLNAVKYSNRFTKTTRDAATQSWGLVPTSCLHVRFEKLRMSGIGIEASDRCLSHTAHRYANANTLVMHDVGRHGSITTAYKDRGYANGLQQALTRHNVTQLSFCANADNAFCQIMDSAVCSHACDVSTCIGGGTFGAFSMCPGVEHQMCTAWKGASK